MSRSGLLGGGDGGFGISPGLDWICDGFLPESEITPSLACFYFLDVEVTPFSSADNPVLCQSTLTHYTLSPTFFQIKCLFIVRNTRRVVSFFPLSRNIHTDVHDTTSPSMLTVDSPYPSFLLLQWEAFFA